MKFKIVRLTKEVEGNIEERMYIETNMGYIPLSLMMEQTEEFSHTKKSYIGEIELPNETAKSIKIGPVK